MPERITYDKSGLGETRDNKEGPNDSFRRLNGLVNVVHSGAKTLTVIAMEEEGEAVSHHVLSKKLKSMAGGGTVVEKASIKGYLTTDLVPLGIAQQEDGNHWTLTRQGEELRPALLFAWHKMLEKEIAQSQVFGDIFLGKREKGEMILPTPTARVIILSQLSSQTLRVIDLARFLGHSPTKTTQIIDSLVSAGLINKEVASGLYGNSMTEFSQTDLGVATSDWGHLVDSKKRKGDRTGNNTDGGD